MHKSLDENQTFPARRKNSTADRAAHRFVLNGRVRAPEWPLRVPRHACASERASASCPRHTGRKAPASWALTATLKRGHVAHQPGTTSSATKHRSQAPRGCVHTQHPLPRPGYQRAAAQQRRPPASTQLLLTGLPSRAHSSEVLCVPGCLLLPSSSCCCCWHSACWKRRCSFSRASSLSIRFSITVRCLSRARKAAEKEPLCPFCPGRFLLSHSHRPAPGCFAAPQQLPAACPRLQTQTTPTCSQPAPAPSTAGLALFTGT